MGIAEPSQTAEMVGVRLLLSVKAEIRTGIDGWFCVHNRQLVNLINGVFLAETWTLKEKLRIR